MRVPHMTGLYSIIITVAWAVALCTCSLERKLMHEQTDSKYRIQSIDRWLIEAGLINVESIIYDSTRKCFYVTNGLEYKSGTDGFISKISENGDLDELKWIEGLSRPTGMAIWDSILYVADVDALLAVHIERAEVVKRFRAPIEHSGLNDVTTDKKGEIFVSASWAHSIFKLEQEKLEVWVTDTTNLQWVNGLEVREGRLLAGGLHLCSIPPKSKKPEIVTTALELKDFDGIACDETNGLFLTTVENSSLYHVDNPDQSVILWQDGNYLGDLEFIPSKKQLFIPSGNHARKEYYILVVSLE